MRSTYILCSKACLHLPACDADMSEQHQRSHSCLQQSSARQLDKSKIVQLRVMKRM